MLNKEKESTLETFSELGDIVETMELKFHTCGRMTPSPVETRVLSKLSTADNSYIFIEILRSGVSDKIYTIYTQDDMIIIRQIVDVDPDVLICKFCDSYTLNHAIANGKVICIFHKNMYDQASNIATILQSVSV